ncbi:hypothetical protein MM239_14865 [Belliella sp. DSM 111904]|uniref:Uncharacterized protein n=1 Tax=Belliella filtrata TaxID=2923435 RepID=A0ABS9V2Q1_9BACT|nr:hypothetical protein [Belliella filtrata]MCH7410687.1 hypothetical protein [Belliella filtrata]
MFNNKPSDAKLGLWRTSYAMSVLPGLFVDSRSNACPDEYRGDEMLRMFQ